MTTRNYTLLFLASFPFFQSFGLLADTPKPQKVEYEDEDFEEGEERPRQKKLSGGDIAILSVTTLAALGVTGVLIYKGVFAKENDDIAFNKDSDSEVNPLIDLTNNGGSGEDLLHKKDSKKLLETKQNENETKQDKNESNVDETLSNTNGTELETETKEVPKNVTNIDEAINENDALIQAKASKNDGKPVEIDPQIATTSANADGVGTAVAVTNEEESKNDK